MNPSPFKLAELTYARTKGRPVDLAVLPWAATEPHNYHLPYATDIHETDRIADRACALAIERNARLILLPTIPFGVQTTQQAFPLAINMSPSTQLAVLADVCESVANSGIPKMVILNGHGGNDFYWMLKELYGQFDLFLATVNWYQLGDMSIFTDPGDHAGEMETSLCLHLIPDLVAPLETADPTRVPPFAVEFFNLGKAKTPRPWDRLTGSTGVGNPRQATAEKGRRYFEQVTRDLADFFVQLANAPLDEHFPFASP
jgi:creatinine amidohydrolase